MYKITQKFQLNTDTFSMWIEAPLVANHAKAGQFIMLRVSETGERIPLTICDKNIKTGEVRIVFQAVGKTTIELAQKEKGEYLADFVGPLGAPTHLPVGVDAHIDPSKSTKVLVIAGGLGTAIALPQVKELYSRKIDTHAILGFRNKDLIILEDEFKASTHEVIVATDDGSNGQKGFVTDVLQNLLQRGARDGAPYALSEINSAPY
ncbi:MAG: hypothetical protein FWE47_03405, partial [Oscillospiraceae bacterium]|nr:hypothetical protein [Oscillospiraceae bacterium]